MAVQRYILIHTYTIVYTNNSCFWTKKTAPADVAGTAKRLYANPNTSYGLENTVV